MPRVPDKLPTLSPDSVCLLVIVVLRCRERSRRRYSTADADGRPGGKAMPASMTEDSMTPPPEIHNLSGPDAHHRSAATREKSGNAVELCRDKRWTDAVRARSLQKLSSEDPGIASAPRLPHTALATTAPHPARIAPLTPLEPFSRARSALTSPARPTSALTKVSARQMSHVARSPCPAFPGSPPKTPGIACPMHP
jgi:hypothetical protein